MPEQLKRRNPKAESPRLYPAEGQFAGFARGTGCPEAGRNLGMGGQLGAALELTHGPLPARKKSPNKGFLCQ